MNRDGYTKLGTDLADLDASWRDRLADAAAMVAAGRTGWAIATALYVLEIRLKVQICKRLDLVQLPRAFEIHVLRGLLLLAGLSRKIQRRSAVHVKRKWDEVITLSAKLNDFRYTPDRQWPTSQAVDLLRSLQDADNGILQWLDKVK